MEQDQYQAQVEGKNFGMLLIRINEPRTLQLGRTPMRNAKQLLQEYNDFSFRDPQAAAEMFTDDGAFEMPYFESLAVPGRYQGHDQIRGFFAFVRELFPDLQLVNTTVVCESADGSPRQPRKKRTAEARCGETASRPDRNWVRNLHLDQAQQTLKENHTEKTIQQKNKDLVLKAFDTLFNRRDYATAQTFWSPKYIQHSAHIEPGRDGLFNLVKSIPATLKYEPGLIVADGDFVIVHGRFSGMGLPVNWIAADILRIENGILVEHWDVIQDEATEEHSKSKAPMFGSSFPNYSKPERTVG